MSKMFSAEFTVADKHSLKHNKYVSTYSYMPWQYTSLYDKQYKPLLLPEIKRKLEAFCRYEFMYSIGPLPDDEKQLKIEHNEENILSFEINNLFQYSNISQYAPALAHFAENIYCPELFDCVDAIKKMTSVTDELTTYVESIEYDANANFKNIMILDSIYDLNEYTDNKILTKVNSLGETHHKHFRGTIGIYPNSSRVKVNIVPKYFEISISRGENTDRLPSSIIRYSNQAMLDVYSKVLLEKELITQEDIEYINTLTNPKSKVDFEILLDEDGEIEDVYAIVYRFNEFQRLS